MSRPLSGRSHPNGATVAPSTRLRTDMATILGLGGALLLVAAAVAMGGSLKAFIDVPSLLIVIGGTFATTTICFSLREVARSQAIMLRAMLRPALDPAAAAFQVMKAADLARKHGILGMQGRSEVERAEPFLRKALLLVIDGMPSDEIERLLRQEEDARLLRHAQSANVFRKAAEIAPALGLIGTLVGLVQMLSNLNDPSAIGPAMAVALLTTFYGAILANVVFAPLAAKLERNSVEEALVNAIYITGAVSIGRQENPRRLEMLLNAQLPPDRRIRFYA